MNTYFINLDRCIQRKKKMEFLYNNLIRIPAYDGNKLESYNNICLIPGYDMNNNEIGCSLSHLKAIITAYKNGDKSALIMEDDIYNSFQYLWRESLNEIISKVPTDVECVQLHCINPDIIANILLSKKRFVKWNEKSWGMGCYYITRKGMYKIVSKYFINNTIYLPICMENKADYNLIYGMLNTVTYTRPLFEHQICESTIHPSHLETIHLRALQIICYYFNKIGMGEKLKAAKLNQQFLV
jgi:GR25 family glycosyltransferase involved in LPS biosynthesis